MPQLPIYLDNHSTTRVDPRVLEEMLPYFTEKYGNPASKTHVFGWAAADAVATARNQVASLIGAEDREVVFTNGATESNNLALKGAAEAYRTQGNHVITSAIEHPAVLDPCKRLERAGCNVTVLPVDGWGLVDVDQLAATITDKTILVSIMAANNEIGTIQPIAAIGQLCKDRRVLFHVDAAQAVGKIPIDVETMGIDLLSVSGHKLHGPKGIGALYVRRRQPHVRLEPQMDGGGHERGLRSGTLPTPLIVGLGKACQICQDEMAGESFRVAALRDRLWDGLRKHVPDIQCNGHLELRLPNNLSAPIAGIRAEALLVAMKTVAASTGSACTSAESGPSHVLKAIGLTEEQTDGTLRFGLSRFTTAEEIDYVVTEVWRGTSAGYAN